MLQSVVLGVQFLPSLVHIGIVHVCCTDEPFNWLQIPLSSKIKSPHSLCEILPELSGLRILRGCLESQ